MACDVAYSPCSLVDPFSAFDVKEVLIAVGILFVSDGKGLKR